MLGASAREQLTESWGVRTRWLAGLFAAAAHAVLLRATPRHQGFYVFVLLRERTKATSLTSVDGRRLCSNKKRRLASWRW